MIINGILDAPTVRLWQQIMGTKADGVISGQYSGNKKYHPANASIQYEGGGSALVRAVQNRLKVTNDGHLGPITIGALQRYLGVTSDGFFGVNAVRTLQNRLNTGRF